MTDESLKATVQVPLSKNDPAKIGFEEIPLPPKEMWTQGSTEPDADEAKAAAPATVTEVAELDFVTSSHCKSVTLKYPFRLSGAVIDRITVRRLTIGELEMLVSGANGLSYMAVYAVMTGLPVEVLRGLIDEDGDAVTEAAYDFLPRRLRMEGD